MKNFDDMGLIEMAKTLGEMGEALKNCKHGSTVCAPCAYDRGVRDSLKIVEDHWSEPEGFSELIEKIKALTQEVK